MWHVKGRQPRVPSAGQNRRVPVFGALDARTGRAVIRLGRSKRAVEFVAFLKRLLGAYPGRHLFLFLDNCSIHHAKMVERFLADHRDRLTVIWNAPYTPELNLIERYWGHLKAKAIQNYYFETVENLQQAIRDAVAVLNRSKELRMQVHLGSLETMREAA